MQAEPIEGMAHVPGHGYIPMPTICHGRIKRGIAAVDSWINDNEREGGFTFSRDFMRHWQAFSGDIVKVILRS